jgi:hypothetical protein
LTGIAWQVEDGPEEVDIVVIPMAMRRPIVIRQLLTLLTRIHYLLHFHNLLLRIFFSLLFLDHSPLPKVKLPLLTQSLPISATLLLPLVLLLFLSFSFPLSSSSPFV